MAKIKGRIVGPGQRKGIGNLIVQATIIDKTTDKITEQALGSALTDAVGNFFINWSSSPEKTAKHQVVLEVETPAKSGGDRNIIFQSKPRTISEGTTTAFLVELTQDVIDNFDVSPTDPSDAESAVIKIKLAAAESEKIDREWAAVARQRVARKRDARTQFSSSFRPKILEEISTRPSDVTKSDQIVVEGEPQRDTDSVTLRTLQKGANLLSSSSQTVEGKSRITRYFLSPEQRVELQKKLDSLNPASNTLRQVDIDEILSFNEDVTAKDKPFELGGEESQLEQYIQLTFDESCAQSILDDSNTEDAENEDGSVEEVEHEFVQKDMNQLLARVTADIDSPLGTLKGRPGQKDVIGNIRDFALSPGPADAPAIFDFHQLNIAFDHVWKEFLDDRIEPLAEAAFLSLVERGGDPNVALPQTNSALDALDAEERLVSSASVDPIPSTIYAQRLPNLPASGLNPLKPDGFDPGPVIDIPTPIPPIEPPIDTNPGGIDFPTTDDKFYDPPSRSLIRKLRDILRGRYAFTAFGADQKSHAINYGVAITYRQRWEPVAYQVGELNHTITLAPGEMRKYATKTKLTRKRVEKEVEKNSSILKDHFQSKTRAESEIIRKAHAKTNFSVAAEGTYNFGVASGDSTSTTNHDSTNTSDSAKKSFREAVMKSSQEYRQERTLEVMQEDTLDFEESESGEIKNPNEELTVTYLFYELQRRFRINEQIFKATPVVLVAQNIPKPNHIDEAFLIRHGWILKRALLDDSYEPSLAYVSGPLAGDKVTKDALFTAMENHRRVVETLKDDLYAMKEQASEGYEALRRAIEARIDESIAEDTDGFFSDVADFFGGDGQSVEGAQAREEAARAHEQRAVEQVKQQTMALQREVSAYTEATDKYTKALRQHKEWELKIVDLLLHIKENIIHYMQAIWAYEHPDERFLRLQYKKAPTFNEINGGASYTFAGDTTLTRDTVRSDGTIETRTAVEFEYSANFDVDQTGKTLSEIADLNTLLGFKGNYMIFPLRENNALTDFMMTPYVDAGFRLLDPHDPGNINREQFARYVCYLRDQLDDAEFEAARPALQDRFRRLLLSEPNQGDEIVVPSGSLYIEALPGSNPLIEDFKLAHRALDVVQAQEGARQSSLDNLRRAALLLDENYDDPDIDAKYLFENTTDKESVVVAPNPGGGGGS